MYPKRERAAQAAPGLKVTVTMIDPGNQVRINFYILMVEFQVCPNLPAGLEQIAFPIHSMGIVSKEGGCELLLLNYLSGPQFLHPQKRDVLQDNRKSPSTSDTVN